MSETPEGFVTLYNPATGAPWDCPEGAVDFWTTEKGWTTEPKAEKAVGAMNKAELLDQVAKRPGLEVASGATNAELVAAIESFDNPQEG